MLRRIALLAAFLLGGSALLLEAEVRWNPLGPPGGFVDFVASSPANPEVVYVGSRAGGGVYASADAGATWRSANSGLGDLRITSLAVAPSDARIVYAATQSGGYRSNDEGASWTPLAGGFPSSIVDAITIDPRNASTVYVSGTSGVLSKSADGGATWESIGNEDTSRAEPQRVAVDPTRGETLYLATAKGGVFRTGDGGRSWDAFDTGLKNVFGDRSAVQTVAVDPSNPRRLYAGTSTDGIFVSTDSGSHWTRSSDGLTYSEDPVSGSRLYNPVSDTLVLPDGTAYAGYQFTVYMRPPGASSWIDLGLDFVSAPVPVAGLRTAINQFSLGAGTPPTLYLATGRNGPGLGGPLTFGAFGRFDPAGLSFHVFSFVTVWSIATDPFSPAAVVLTANGSFEHEMGEAWGGPLPYYANFSFLLPICAYFDARTPGVVYAGSGGRVYKSLDGGRTYPTGALVGDSSTLPATLVETFLAEPGSSGIFAGTTTGFYVSEDQGVSWTAASSDLASRSVYSLAADASEAATLWAGTDDGVYRSADAGAHWSRTGASLGGRVNAVLAVAGGGRLLAGGEQGLAGSRDGGVTWTPLAGITTTVNALAQDPVSGLVATATAEGMFESEDGGVTWTRSNAGLDNPNVLCLAFLHEGTLLAGTSGGVFERIVTMDRGTAASTPPRPRSPRSLPERP